ncbi:Ras guanine nucleotide exchange factor [Tieghemostelium lacteum]|uniref:Ras guanine nucleotide exchange factor n=1 Tax=Tieghemostelium lacteum TaxID=361077 RepID=A0A151ZSP5_TIELA|nr:Ras guanine nucleotide exchange factor [Tieghemostelium lacteum]|eukprot:KYQ96804.1 Ras guanine nucleotide exchange factor [Tieghemostelium lacteum]
MSSPSSNSNSPISSTLQQHVNTPTSTPKKKLGHSQLSLVSNNSSDQSSNVEEVFIPPSEWVPKAMHTHADILELRERIRPLSQNKSFSRNRRSGKTEAKGVINDTMLTKLLMQYLHEENLTSTLKIIQEETKIKFVPNEVEKESLVSILRVGVKTTGDWFEEIDFNLLDMDPEVEAYHAYGTEQDLSDPTNKENLMDDRHDEKQFVKNPDGTIALSTLNKLIWWFIGNVSNSSDINEYKKIFFLTYQTFTTAEVLLSKFIQIYLLLISDSESTEAFQVMQLLKFWVEQQPNDFNDKLLTTLTNFNDNQVSNNQWSKNLRQAISKLNENQNNHIKRKESKDPPEPRVPKNIFSPTLTLDDVDEEEIARQLCLIDFALYEQIKSSEFLIKGWTKPQFRSKAVNLLAMIRRFNDFTKWVASSILTEQNPRGRVKLLSRYLKICDHLRTLNNFHSLMAIYGGINNTHVFRTKSIRKDLSKQQQDTYNELEKLFTSDSNYKTYRIAYQNAKPPAVPFLGIHLRDLTFVDEGSPDKIDNMINLNKRRTLWRVISNTIRYQPIPYNFLKVHQISLFLTELKLDAEQTQTLDLSHDTISMTPSSPTKH